MKQKQLMNMLAATVALLITTLGMPQTAQAAKNYGFHVGGVYVTPDNCNNITGNNIKPYNGATDSKVWYVPGTNTLYVRNTRVERSGGSNRCIRNETNPGLTIVFIGDNYFYSKNSEAIRLEANTTLMGDKADPRPNIYTFSSEYQGIYVEKKSTVSIQNLYIITSSAKNHAILGSFRETLELNNVNIYCAGTGDNKAVVANFGNLTLKNSHISTSSDAKKTYGIRIEYIQCFMYIVGTSTITSVYPAIHTNGTRHYIEGLEYGSMLEATSSADCAIYADWYSEKLGPHTIVWPGILIIKNLNFKLKGSSSGIRGNRYNKNYDRPKITLENTSGIIQATEPGSGLITNLEDLFLKDCHIEEPYGAYFDKNKHELCDINGNIITYKVRIEKGLYTDVEAVKTDEPATVSEIYSADGRRQSEMRRGLNIVRMTDGTTKKVIVK